MSQNGHGNNIIIVYGENDTLLDHYKSLLKYPITYQAEMIQHQTIFSKNMLVLESTK